MRIAEISGGAGGAMPSRAPAFEQALSRAAGGEAPGEPKTVSGPGAVTGAQLRCDQTVGAGAPSSGLDANRSVQLDRALSAVERVAAAQQRLDSVLRMASEGKGLSAGALLALQADVYRSSQLLELAGKVVERATSGVKQILTTQL